MGEIVLGIFLAFLMVGGYLFYVALSNDSYPIKHGSAEKKKVSKGIVATMVVVPILLMTLIASTVSIGTGDIAVMTRFGRVTGQELNSGFHMKNPLDSANVYDVKVQKEQSSVGAASKDLQDVSATVVVNYHLNSGSVFDIHKNVGIDYHNILIDPATQETFKSATAQFNATQLIDDRPQVKQDVTDSLSARLNKYGIVIDSVSITNFDFSKEFNASIEAKQVAQQQAEQAQFNLQKANLDAEANQVQTTALTPAILQQQAISKWDGKLPNTLAGGATVFNIPLQ